MPVIDLKDTTIYLRDRETNWVEVRVGEGNLTYSERRNIDLDKDRGKLARLREGEQEPLDVSFQFLWEYLRSDGAEPPTLEEALKKQGPAASWVSAATDPLSEGVDASAPYSVHIQIVRDSPCGLLEQTVLVEFNWTELAHDSKNGTIDCKGLCNRVVSTSERLT